MEIFTGRPENCAERLAKEVRCYDLLDSLGIVYRRADHPAAMTMEACVQIDQAFGAEICKNLLLCNRQQTAFYLLLLPPDKPFRTSVLSKAIGSSRLSFASAEHMEAFLDITPGSLSVLGLMNDKEHRVQLLIDEDLLRQSVFGCHPCINTSSLKLRTRDLLETILPAIHHQYTVVDLPNE